MKSKKLLWLFLFAVLAVGGFILFQRGAFSEKSPIQITAVMNGDYVTGETTALNAINMRIDEVNKEGGVNGHPLRLEVEWLGADPDKTPERTAQKIAQENSAMIVLGNGYSDPAIVMGEIFAENKIPAITSGAGTPAVTEDNDWFFRVINNNSSQGKFIAEYARAFLGYESAAIIYNENNYGTSLKTAFEKSFAEQGGTIVDSAGVENNTETLDEEIKRIIDSYEEAPDMIFLATYRDTGASAIFYAKERYPKMPIMISSEAANSSFASQVAEYLDERKAGDVLNGVYAASPLIFDVASEGAQVFQNDYKDEFENQLPTWYSATSYDSVLVAIEAMRAAGISGDPALIEEDRQKIRDYLESIDNLDAGFSGITGDIYFDKDHNVDKPMAMGVFENDKFISAPVQLYEISPSDLPVDYREKVRNGDILKIYGRYFGKTRIVYVGVDINEFDNVDVDGTRTYLVDFYLWFRYEGEELDFSNVRFDNVTSELTLDTPLEEYKLGDEHYVLFKIRDTFRNSFDLGDYPFDHQLLQIKLRHTLLERKEVIFVTDLLGIGDISTESIIATLKEARSFDTVNDWFPTTGYFFTDTVRDFGTRGKPSLFDEKTAIQHSRFNVAIEVQRDYIRFVSKTMLPIFAILILSYLALFLPNREFETITSIMTGTVLSVIFFHVDLSGRLNVGYPVAMDYAFYTIYALLAVEVYLSIVAWRKISKNNVDMSVKYLFWFMRALYPIVFIAGVAAIIVKYNLL